MSASNQPTCVVTGGSSGIGLATSRLFAGNGYRVAICGRNPDRLESAKLEIQEAYPDSTVITQVADLSHENQALGFVEFAVESFGRIDVLLNNAGTAPLASFHEMESSVLRNLIDLNVLGVVATTRAAWKQMTSQADGVVINISSMSAIDPFPGLGLYGGCKAFVETFTLAAARDGEPNGIRVYGIRPGAVETPMLRNLFPEFPSDQAVSPEEIASDIWRLVTEPSCDSGTIVEVRK